MYESEPGNTEHFLLVDSGPDAERILFNGRQRNLEFALHNDFFMDGTLKIASCLFKHIIIIVII